MRRSQVLAFRAARHSLDERRPRSFAAAAACPIAEVSPGAGAVALAARTHDVTRATYEFAVETDQLVLAPTLRAALHLVAPEGWAATGRGLISEDEQELLAQLGPAAARHLGGAGISAVDALGEVAAATEAALEGGRALSRDELHEELRGRVRAALLPWCAGCGSHHVSPMLWRYAGVRAGMRMDARRRFRAGSPAGDGGAQDALQRFLHHYAPATPNGFASWAGIASSHASRIWRSTAADLIEVDVEGHRRWLPAGDAAALADPPESRGIRLLPPRDPYVVAPDRETLVPDPELRRKLFRPVADPGAVLFDGRLAGLWRSRLRGRRLEVEVEALEAMPPAELQDEATSVAHARGAGSATVRSR